MALFDGRKALEDVKRTCRISSIENNDTVIIYIIRIEVGSAFWTVRHRYSEFHELNEKLIQQHNFEKSILPPKKLFGNHSDRFVRKRQLELEVYLQDVLETYLTKGQHLPVVLRTFLDFHRYEVRGITQTLSESFYHYGDNILAAGSLFTMTPLQLSSLTERLKLAEPTYDSEDKSKDLGHVLDFTSQLLRLHIEGSDGTIGQSNLVMNKLFFDLSCFKSVKELQIYNCDMQSLKGVGNLRSTVKQLIIKNSLHSIHDVLMCDVLHWPLDDTEMLTNSCWNGLEIIQLRQNKIQQIDVAMKLLKNIKCVDISHNLLSEVSNLETLSSLTNLNLSNNRIQYIDGLHMKLGNIRHLDLSSNNIVKLDGLSKLYSLESLNLGNNKVEELSEVQYLSILPCLESLKLNNNPVTTAVDYRIKTLVFFASRIAEISLDDKAATQKEKDTVAVIHAIKVSKETKSENPFLNKSTKSTTHNVQISSCDEENPQDRAEFSGFAPKQYETQVDVSTNVLEFKHQVELIRKQGGDSWLRLLNTMRTIDKSEHNLNEMSPGLLSNQNEMLMPDMSFYQTDFLQNIEPLNKDPTMKIELVVWCILVSSYAGGCLCKIPACVIFTNDVIFILSVIDLPEGDLPELKLSSKVLSSQLQAVSHSFYFFYIKLSISSESNTGYQNFLLLNERVECQNVTHHIQAFYHINVQSEEDIYSSNVKFEMAKKIKMNDTVDSKVLYYQRVARNCFKASLKKSVFHWLCLTHSHVMLMEENLLASNSATVFRPHFTVHCAIRIQCLVANISINDVTKVSNVDEECAKAEMPFNVPQLLFHYGYNLNIKFEGGVNLDIRFPTKSARDQFLELFTRLKAI